MGQVTQCSLINAFNNTFATACRRLMSFLAIIILVVSGCQSSDRQIQGQSLSGQLPIRASQRLEPKELTKKSQQSTEKKAQLGSVDSESTDDKEQLYLFNSFNKNLRNSIQSNNRSRNCLLYTSPSPRDVEESRMPSSA